MDTTVIAMIGFLVSGEIQEDVVGTMPAAQCEAFVQRIALDVRGPRKSRPTVTLNDGQSVPVIGAGCLPACDADAPEPLTLLKDEI
jgi:hypothetical protein